MHSFEGSENIFQPISFSGCKSLEELILPEIKALNGSMLSGCTSLKVIEIPSSVEEIVPQAFFDSSVEEVILSYGVKRIGVHAFFNVKSLKKVIIPLSVEEIESAAFVSCSNLEEVEFTAGSESGDYNISVLETAFNGCNKIREVVLPEGVNCKNFTISDYNDHFEKFFHEKVIDASVESSCTSFGLTEGCHCSVCGKILVEQNTIPKTEHVMVTTYATMPSCETMGSMKKTFCSSCGEVFDEQVTVPALGHTVVIDPARKALFCVSKDYCRTENNEDARSCVGYYTSSSSDMYQNGSY